MTIGPTNGFDEFMNSERSYHVIMQMAKKEMIEQDRELLKEQITRYTLMEYDEQEKVHYSWREFFATFALVIYNVIIITIVFNVSLNWRLTILAIHAILLLFVGIFYSKIKKHYKNQKEIDDLLCQYGVISMKDQPQHEEALYQQLVEKKVF